MYASVSEREKTNVYKACKIKKEGRINKNGGSQKAADNPLFYRMLKVLPVPNTENKHWIKTPPASFETIKKKHNTAAFSIFFKHEQSSLLRKIQNCDI